MSYFDDASLVMIPSGYKDQKVYSVKPLDGSGDLTFSRASNATRVASNGLIEKVRTNLFTYSEDFTNAAWVKDGATFSVDTLTGNAGTSFKGLYQGQTTQGLQNVYFDVAYVSHQWGQILFGTTGSDLGYANFDIQNKVVGNYSGVGVPSIQDFGTYVRISVSVTTTNKTSVTFAMVDSSSSTRAASTSSTGSVKMFRAQNEVGDIATDYIATTTAAVSVGPVSGLPRLDYLNSSCPRLLLEPQRSSIVTYSEQLNNAAWIKQTVTISANSSVSPDGYSNADKVAINNGVSGGYVYQSISTTSSTVYTTSFFIKAAGVNFTKFFSNVTGTYVDAVINLTTGGITNSTFATTPTTTNYGNGWWRVSYTETSGGGTVPIYVDGGSTSTGGGITGNGTDGILIWGAQVEAGAYATSYIPTLGTSVTRVADAASKTGISSLIGQTEGTMFVEFQYTNTKDTFWPIFSAQGSSGELIEWYGSSGSSAISVTMIDGGVTQFSRSVALSVGTHKMALAYAENNTILYLDGVVVGGVDTLCTIPTLTDIGLGKFTYSSAYTYGDTISQALLFKTRLTNAQLAELTTL